MCLKVGVVCQPPQVHDVDPGIKRHSEPLKDILRDHMLVPVIE